jgi:DNA-binding Lrp family transcriptional regulator
MGTETVAATVKKTEETRTALMLRSEGLTIPEIARRLGMRPTTVERRIAEGLEGDGEYEIEHMRVMVEVRLQWMQQRLAEVEANPTMKGASARVAALNAMRGVEADRRRLWGLDYDPKAGGGRA